MPERQSWISRLHFPGALTEGLPHGWKLCVQEGVLFTIVTPLPERDPALTENPQVQLPQTLGARYSAGRISGLSHLNGHRAVAQACFLGWGRWFSEA